MVTHYNHIWTFKMLIFSYTQRKHIFPILIFKSGPGGIRTLKHVNTRYSW